MNQSEIDHHANAGRKQIKNAVRTGQSVALIEKKPLGMDHLLQVLRVGAVFAKDLKGPGYEEALKMYM